MKLRDGKGLFYGHSGEVSDAMGGALFTISMFEGIGWERATELWSGQGIDVTAKIGLLVKRRLSGWRKGLGMAPK